jgi:hypothetical protein
LQIITNQTQILFQVKNFLYKRHLWLILLIICSANIYGKNFTPCSIIHNFTQNSILVTWDPDWDDQVLTYGANDKHESQKILRRPLLLQVSENITICNKFSFNFALSNEYMTGIMIGSIGNLNNDGVAIVLGTRMDNANLVITYMYNFSQHFNISEYPSEHFRTNNIIIL